MENLTRDLRIDTRVGMRFRVKIDRIRALKNSLQDDYQDTRPSSRPGITLDGVFSQSFSTVAQNGAKSAINQQVWLLSMSETSSNSCLS